MTTRGPRELWYDHDASAWRGHAPDEASTQSAEDEYLEESQLEPLCSVDQLHDGMKTLTARQRFVLELRYGMRDGQTYTIREVAELMGVTHQTVLDHEQSAVKRLEKTLSKHLLHDESPLSEAFDSL